MKHEHPSGAGKIVLVVDDDPALRTTVRRVLSQHDYDVREAGSAHEARRVLGKLDDSPDLVIMDLVLPGLEGREAANLIKAHHPDVPVVYTSGYTSMESVRSGLVRAGETFLRKPFDARELLEAVESELGGR